MEAVQHTAHEVEADFCGGESMFDFVLDGRWAIGELFRVNFHVCTARRHHWGCPGGETFALCPRDIAVFRERFAERIKNRPAIDEEIARAIDEYGGVVEEVFGGRTSVEMVFWGVSIDERLAKGLRNASKVGDRRVIERFGPESSRYVRALWNAPLVVHMGIPTEILVKIFETAYNVRVSARCIEGALKMDTHTQEL
jgi:hypothetical protein